jgi:hypothetical protein
MRRRRTRLLPAYVAAAVALLVVLAGCGSSPHRTTTTSGPRPTGSKAAVWLVTRAALAQLLTDPAVEDKLRRKQVYEILRPGQRPLAGVPAFPVVVFPSVAELRRNAATPGRVRPGTYAILYDPEAWSFTPVAEQQDPVQAARQAAKIARAHGLRLIVAPGLDLIKVLDYGGSGPRWRRFLDLNLAGQLARIADVVGLQSQSLERSTSTYSTFVRAATAQISAARPATRVLAGLSANPSGARVDSQQLTSDVQAVQSLVHGFWINIPRPGKRCPKCNLPRPDIAIKVVRETS